MLRGLAWLHELRSFALVVLLGLLVATCLPHWLQFPPLLVEGETSSSVKDVSYRLVEEKVNVVLSESGEAEFSVFLSVENLGSESISSFSFVLEVTNISGLSIVNFSAPLYSYRTDVRRYDTIITINTLILPGEVGNFSLSFATSQAVMILYTYSQFVFREKVEVDVGKFILEVWLPPRCFLYSGGAEPFYPEPTSNFTDGERLFFKWEYDGLTAGDYLIFFLYYSPSGAEPASSVAIVPLPMYFSPLSPACALVVAAGSALCAVGVIGAVLFYKRRRKGFSDVVFPLLSDAEREVLKLLSDSGGVMSQREIQSKTGYSKAKVSVTVNMLEKKGLVEREARGRMRIVRLSGKVKV